MLRAAGRLVRADLRQRPLQAALTGLVVAIAAGALLVTMHLRAVMEEPFNDLMVATNGAHLNVMGPPAAVAEASALPEVAEAGAPRRLVLVAAAEGRDRLVLSALPARATVDRPLVIDGRLPRRPGELALNRALALAMGVGPGDRMSVGGERLEVVGVAVLPLPSADGWVTPDQVAALTPAPPEEGERVDRGGGRRRAAARRPGRRRRGRPAARRRRRGACQRLARGAQRLHRRVAPHARDPRQLDAARAAGHLLHAGDRDRRPRAGRPAPDRPPALGRGDPGRRHRGARRPLPDGRAARRAGRPARGPPARSAAAGRHARPARHAPARTARRAARRARAAVDARRRGAGVRSAGLAGGPAAARRRAAAGARYRHPARIARRARRSRPAVAGDGGARGQGRVRPACARPVDRRQPRARRRDGGVRAGLRDHHGPPGHRPGAARPALGGGGLHGLDAAPGRSTGCWRRCPASRPSAAATECSRRRAGSSWRRA